MVDRIAHLGPRRLQSIHRLEALRCRTYYSGRKPGAAGSLFFGDRRRPRTTSFRSSSTQSTRLPTTPSVTTSRRLIGTV